MQEFHAVDGQLHRVIYEPVDGNAAESETQSQIDEAQNQFNAAMQFREQTEQIYAAAEATAEQASIDLDAARLAEQEAEGLLQKSLVKRDSLAKAKLLAAEQLESGDVEEVDAGTDEEDENEPTSSEAVDIPVNLAA